jgi:hypothetical protein
VYVSLGNKRQNNANTASNMEDKKFDERFCTINYNFKHKALGGESYCVNVTGINRLILLPKFTKTFQIIFEFN